MKHISPKDTAKLIRDVLKESFPGVKFSVKTKTYSGGASIDIYWTDGPSDALVSPICDLFSGAYFDGMIDYKGYRTHMLDGERVHFGADYTFTHRDYSPPLIQKAIDAAWTKYRANFELKDIAKPTVDDFVTGRLYNVVIFPKAQHDSVQALIRENMIKRSTVAAPAPSATLARIRYVGDEGYGETATGKVNHLKVVK